MLLYKYRESQDVYGTVCDSLSYFRDSANAVCRKMGFDRYVSWEAGRYSWDIQKSFKILMNKLSCSDENIGFMERCSFSFNAEYCEHSDDVFLECACE